MLYLPLDGIISHTLRLGGACRLLLDLCVRHPWVTPRRTGLAFSARGRFPAGMKGVEAKNDCTEGIVAHVSMKALLEAGVHFGHRTRRWNPKMKPFIFTERNGIHILDLQQTIVRLEQAYDLVRDTVADGGTVLLVGTKKQARENLALAAESCGVPYVNVRWLGGTLTNWQTIKQRISYLLELEQRREIGDFERLPKKEALKLDQLIVKLNRRLGGLKTMTRLPNLVFLVDVRREAIAVKEGNILKIPVLAMVDTNCDPDPIDLVIPSNDDAIRAIKLVVNHVADAVNEGLEIRQAVQADEDVEEDEMYLGAATLAKLRSGDFDFEEANKESDESED
jgi:small subunit ribosomal protein S2